MRYLLLVFWLCVLLLGVLLWRQQESNVFADGHLVCPPLPAALVAAQVPPMAPPPSGVLALLAQPRPVEPVCQSMKIKILEPPRESEQVTRLRVADQADWGIARMAEPTPVAVASLAHVRPVRPAPALVSASEVTSPTEVVPNLYLPEGALNEEGAMLTLIKPELAAFEEPSLEAKPAPFVMKAGERVRPLTRFRNDTDFDWVKFERDQKEWWAQAEYFIRVDPRNETSAQMHNLVIGQEAVDRDSALVPDYQPDDLVGVAHEYVLDGKELRLRREAAQALVRMIEEAKAQGLTLRVFSGFRGFAYQKKLYLEAIAKSGPKQNGTAVPGYSEHQLGTTVDICNADRRYVLSSKLAQTPEGKWLEQNAEKFGFRHSYTSENTEEVGYKPEPWHLRYVGVQNAVDSSPTRLAQK